MVVEREISDFILEVFEEQEESFYFPLTSQKDARAFVKALHIKGVEYDHICDEIGEFQHNFESWKKGLGRPGVGNRIIEMINRPLQEILFSDGEEEDESEEEEEEEKIQVKSEPKVKAQTKVAQKQAEVVTHKSDKEKQRDVTDSWVNQVSEKMKEIKVTEKASSSESSSESEDDGEDKDESESDDEDQKTEEEDITDEDEEEDKKPEVSSSSGSSSKESTPESSKESTTSATTEDSSDGDKPAKEATAQVENDVVSREVTDSKVTHDTRSQESCNGDVNVTTKTEVVKNEKDFISSDSSSIMEEEISENYDSDLDIEGLDPNSETVAFIKRVSSMKAEVSDGPGYIYVFTDSPSYVREQRVKIGASRHPNKRLEQAMCYNISMKLASAVAVSSRREALRDVRTQLKGSKVEGQEDWFKAPLDKILSTVSETASRFAQKDSEC